MNVSECEVSNMSHKFLLLCCFCSIFPIKQNEERDTEGTDKNGHTWINPVQLSHCVIVLCFISDTQTKGMHVC